MEELANNTFLCRCCNLLKFQEDLDILANLTPKQALDREIREVYREETSRGLDAPRSSRGGRARAGHTFDGRAARNARADREESELSNVFGCRLRLDELDLVVKRAAAARVTPSELIRKSLATASKDALQCVEPPPGLTRKGSKDLTVRLSASQSITVHELARELRVRSSEVLRRVALRLVA